MRCELGFTRAMQLPAPLASNSHQRQLCSRPQPSIDLIPEQRNMRAGGMATETIELFVKQAEAYKEARPRAPEELYAYIASLTRSHELAWDVGTGNGQAAAVVRSCETFSAKSSLGLGFHILSTSQCSILCQ